MLRETILKYEQGLQSTVFLPWNGSLDGGGLLLLDLDVQEHFHLRIFVHFFDFFFFFRQLYTVRDRRTICKSVFSFSDLKSTHYNLAWTNFKHFIINKGKIFILTWKKLDAFWKKLLIFRTHGHGKKVFYSVSAFNSWFGYRGFDEK